MQAAERCPHQNMRVQMQWQRTQMNYRQCLPEIQVGRANDDKNPAKQTDTM